MNSRLAASAAIAFSSFFLLASTCKEEIDADLFAVDKADPNDLSGTAGVIAAHAKAWNDRDLGAYAALLSDPFRFYPLPEEANEILWLDGDSWGREIELGIVSHMFNAAWSGSASPISAIHLIATPIQTDLHANRDADVICNLEGWIETGPEEGYGVDTRLLLDMDWSSGVYRIRSIREIPITGGARASSLGSIKAVYR